MKKNAMSLTIITVISAVTVTILCFEQLVKQMLTLIFNHRHLKILTLLK